MSLFEPYQPPRPESQREREERLISKLIRMERIASEFNFDAPIQVRKSITHSYPWDDPEDYENYVHDTYDFHDEENPVEAAAGWLQDHGLTEYSSSPSFVQGGWWSDPDGSDGSGHPEGFTPDEQRQIWAIIRADDPWNRAPDAPPLGHPYDWTASRRTANDMDWGSIMPSGSPYPFIFHPMTGWLTWGNQGGVHDTIVNDLARAGQKVPAGSYYGRWYPEQDDVNMYDREWYNLPWREQEKHTETILRNAPGRPQDASGGPAKDEWHRGAEGSTWSPILT